LIVIVFIILIDNYGGQCPDKTFFTAIVI